MMNNLNHLLLITQVNINQNYNPKIIREIQILTLIKNLN